MNNARTSRLSRSPYWVLSMILHVGLLGWLIWYGPVRDIILERGKPKREALIRGKELEEVIEKMQLSVAEELEARVELLKNGQDRMATNFDTLNTHFQPFEESQKATALMRFKKYASALEADQTALLQILIEAQANKNYHAASLAGQEKVPVMISALDEIRRGVLLLTKDPTIPQMHAMAETTLFEVEKPLRDIGNLLGRHHRLAREIEESKAQMLPLKSVTDASEQDRQRQQIAYDKLVDEIKTLKEKLKVLRNARPKDNLAIKQANDSYQASSKMQSANRKTLGGVVRKARDDLNKFNREKQRLEDRQKAFAGLNMQAKLPEMLKSAIDNLTQAIALETQVIEQVYSSDKDQQEAQSEVPAL